MALIRCSECGRMISDKAAACVGCGAPLSPIAGFEIAPRPDHSPPPTPSQLRWRLLLSALALVAGSIWSASAQHASRPGNRIGATLAALLVIGGLCGLIATVLHQVLARRRRAD